jgi:RNA methyltransferase, TrmH family
MQCIDALNTYLCKVSILSKAQVKHIQSFALKKYRDEQHCFVAEGLKNISDLIKHIGNPVELFCTNPLQLPKETMIEEHEMKKISNLFHPSNCLAIFKKPTFASLDVNQKISLVLDGIQDPGNLGTIIRTAHWFGIQNIICSLDTADAYAPKVVQASMGSIGAVHILRKDLPTFLTEQNNIPIIAASLQGLPIKDYKRFSEAIIVMGKEGEGIRPDVAKLCSHHVKIDALGNAESLNVAVATGILCHYFC